MPKVHTKNIENILEFVMNPENEANFKNSIYNSEMTAEFYMKRLKKSINAFFNTNVKMYDLADAHFYSKLTYKDVVSKLTTWRKNGEPKFNKRFYWFMIILINRAL